METGIDTANLIKGIIGSLVRAGLSGVVGWFVAKGLITGEQGAALIPAAIGGVIVVAWAVWNKYKIQERISVALGLPQGAGPEELDAAVKRQ